MSQNSQESCPRHRQHLFIVPPPKLVVMVLERTERLLERNSDVLILALSSLLVCVLLLPPYSCALIKIVCVRCERLQLVEILGTTARILRNQANKEFRIPSSD
jgi:hypothetical protein